MHGNTLAQSYANQCAEHQATTAAHFYNGRDQLTEINQAGCVRTFSYADGHGRLTSRTTPEQGQTAYAYNTNDTVQRVTDARGAISIFAYNGRGLVTNIDYVAAGGSVETGDVGLTYDAAGNRQRMTDGHGAVDYNYDQLSRLTWERRSFNGLGGAQYTINYGYDLAGQVTSIQNQWGSQVSYTRDHVGQVTGIQGAGSTSAPTYASNLRYRAFGGLRNQTFGNNHQLQM